MTIYLVRRHDGTFMSYGGYWVEDMDEAQVYKKIGPAKGRVTRWAKHNPNEPHPTLLAWLLTEADAHVVDLSENTTKALARIQRRKLEREKAHASWELEELTRKQAEIQSRLNALKATSSA